MFKDSNKVERHRGKLPGTQPPGRLTEPFLGNGSGVVRDNAKTRLSLRYPPGVDLKCGLAWMLGTFCASCKIVGCLIIKGDEEVESLDSEVLRRALAVVNLNHTRMDRRRSR
ncbi:hypothetical protein E2C01_049561 [Portunus trituberculatus]|uniref:Uncharacterized protein n=1 Tax=Portunus trituberculatus TaxID=210409 RepID=A0A5B7GER2_PORTR|nr:hypothetical protein [Portunus trituberculatus]